MNIVNILELKFVYAQLNCLPEKIDLSFYNNFSYKEELLSESKINFHLKKYKWIESYPSAR